jgi:hypothetical protein
MINNSEIMSSFFGSSSWMSQHQPLSLNYNHYPPLTLETCLLMLKKIRTEREAGDYEMYGDIFKGLMKEFEKTIEAFVGSYMILLTIYSYNRAQEHFSNKNVK